MYYLGEQLLLLVARIAVFEEKLERRADYEFVEFLGLAVDGDVNLAVLALDVRDLGIEERGVL